MNSLDLVGENCSYEIPCVVGGKKIFTGKVTKQVMPSNHQHVLAQFHEPDANVIQEALKACAAAKKDWEAMPWEHRASIWLKVSGSPLLSPTAQSQG